MLRGVWQYRCKGELQRKVIMTIRPHTKWMLLLLLIIVLFFWKIAFTNQFSVLVEYEGANQNYAWHHFAAASAKQGTPPLWDPYLNSGRSFVGEMATGAFYPMKIAFYVWPFDRSGLFSTRLYHWYYIFAHVFAAWFMFLFARELGLAGFAAFVTALCFALGGFVAKAFWTDTLDSAIWLPVIFLFLLRALNAKETRWGILYACLTGVGLGIATLGGRIHVVMMDVLAVVGAAIYHAARRERPPEGWLTLRSPLIWSAVVIAVAVAICFMLAAVQLLPSLEWSQSSLRTAGSIILPARQRIPYHDLSAGFLPRSIMSFLLVFPSGGRYRGR